MEHFEEIEWCNALHELYTRFVLCCVVLIYDYFLHDWPWISPWIKSIFNELDITIHVIASQLPGHCDVISRTKIERVRYGDDVKRLSFLSSFMDSLCRVRNNIMYVLSWQTVSALTRALFWCLFPSLLRNSGIKHQNNTLVSVETVRYSSTYIILYISAYWLWFRDWCWGYNTITPVHLTNDVRYIRGIPGTWVYSHNNKNQNKSGWIIIDRVVLWVVVIPKLV